MLQEEAEVAADVVMVIACTQASKADGAEKLRAQIPTFRGRRNPYDGH